MIYFKPSNKNHKTFLELGCKGFQRLLKSLLKLWKTIRVIFILFNIFHEVWFLRFQSSGLRFEVMDRCQIPLQCGETSFLRVIFPHSKLFYWFISHKRFLFTIYLSQENNWFSWPLNEINVVLYNINLKNRTTVTHSAILH